MIDGDRQENYDLVVKQFSKQQKIWIMGTTETQRLLNSSYSSQYKVQCSDAEFLSPRKPRISEHGTTWNKILCAHSRCKTTKKILAVIATSVHTRWTIKQKIFTSARYETSCVPGVEG